MDERSGTVFLGVGGAGCHMLDAFFRASLDDPPSAIAAHMDAEMVAALALPARIVLGGEAAEGVSSGGDPEAGARAAEASVEEILARCARARLVVVIAGLGGGTGTGGGPILARRLREAGALVLAVVTLPFFFEGPLRRRRAEEGLRAFRAGTDAVVVFPNQRMLDFHDGAMPVADAFERVDRHIGGALLALARVVESRGLIRLDFADLRAMVRSCGGTLAMAWAEGEGPDRATAVADELTRSPLLEHGNVLSMARALLVGIVGGTDLRMAEVQTLLARLGEAALPAAGFHFGVDIRPDHDGRVAVAVLAAETEAPERAEAKPEADAAAGEGEAGKTGDPAGARQPGRATRSRAVQGSLPLDGSGKGRFRNVEPTLVDGEDLDVPTFLRRGLTGSRR